MDDLNWLISFFGWCSVLNIGILLFAAICVICLRPLMVRIHNKIYGVSEQALPLFYLQYLAYYKMGILLFNLVPYFALRLL